ncbi:ATP-dependent DNA helicase Q1 isoform X1 [Ornithorhynchus anatinus]|uniref:ATP-dependent DNA helicase n=1 Tax=Ornithorhynchus anatinus TaxID=9258 RepID=F7BB16_ORNAN|nr:ATP-dependent DNA helicase Q1 isoform X1 [Ornithorhynchus anatinus]
MAALAELTAELDGADGELRAVETRIRELLERQRELIRKKEALTQEIRRALDAPRAGAGSDPDRDADGDPEAWTKQDFPWAGKVKEAMRDVFKLPRFRPLQLETINATMAGREIFLVMPTGGGKSLCYQLPAVCSPGFTLVICPLISLMEDQLMTLERLGISAASLNASSSKEEVRRIHAEMARETSALKLLYVTPEKIARSKAFLARLEKAYEAGTLARIAVDEVHCCSQWGHDFRPDYKALGVLKRQFPRVPVVGLTATATRAVLGDARNILGVHNCLTFTASFDRPNLYYEVRRKPPSPEDFIEDVAKLINGRYAGQSGIIYCFSQKDSEQVTTSLRQRGIEAAAYHANMEAQDKTRVHKKWSANEIQVVVATVAFGMGIDKPDVRFVIHHSMSKSMENYYQESGRAGRDDQRADCILYSGFGDIFRISSMVVMESVGQQKLYDMVSYCLDEIKCRRALIARHFDEVWASTACNGMCDNCRRETPWEAEDVSGHCRTLVRLLERAERLGEKLTPLKLLDAWTGKGPARLRLDAAPAPPPTLKRHRLEKMIAHFLLRQYLREDFSFTAFATISYLKKGSRAHLLTDDSHVVTMQVRKAGPQTAEGESPQRPGSQTGGVKGDGDAEKAGRAPPRPRARDPEAKRRKRAGGGDRSVVVD